MRCRVTEYPSGWRFQFIADNGEPEDLSEPYPEESDAKEGARTLAVNLGGDPSAIVFDVVRMPEDG